MSASGLRSTLEHACAEERCSASALTVLATRTIPSGSTPRRGTATVNGLPCTPSGSGLATARSTSAACTTCSVSRGRQARWLAIQEHRGRLGLAGHARGQGGALARLPPVRPDHRRPQRRAGDQHPRAEARAAAAAVDQRRARHLGARGRRPGADVYVDSFQVDQPYRLVFFGEKTSLEDVLAPIARDCAVDLYLPAGEISDTMLHQMAEVGAADGRPMVVLCFSDCDPAGWQMPISIGRKLQGPPRPAVPRPALRGDSRRLGMDQVRELGEVLDELVEEVGRTSSPTGTSSTPRPSSPR